MIEALLDLSNIVGGFLLALALLTAIPQVGDGLARAGGAIGPFGWVVGIVALVCGGYFLLYHLANGPHVFHFEVVAILVGVALLWDRLTGRSPLVGRDSSPRGGSADPLTRRDPAVGGRRTAVAQTGTATGWGLILAIFGIIAMIVGIQGLLTPN